MNFDPGKPVLGRAIDDRGGVRTREIKLRRKDGKPAIFLDSSRAVWDTSGNIIRYQGTLVDITDRRGMEQQLAQQEEFRRRLLESFPDLILVVDLAERYTFVSARAKDLLGYDQKDMSGRKSQTWPTIRRSWLRYTTTSFRASRCSAQPSSARGTATEAGGRCVLPAANWQTRTDKLRA